ncbi:type I restriction-modification system subunit M [Collinsella tanakaei]|uniref:type I restriction-modification system subunit M n=1 Tax=Collinsella tanakaei TaxID=626935 RepID=UPI001F29C218|nr:class I SAM-dependent DNA methyltransferase [Collinsella tanakaei]MCF2621580.1 SAM-dependent DNA methyltransferase [Collinsella tanakaei]
MITGELKTKVDGIWDIFWSNGVSNPLTVIEQLTYLMFIKILDDNETRRERNAELLGEPVTDSIFDAEHQNCRWHIFRNYEPDAMYENMVQNVFPFIKGELGSNKDTAFAKYMKDAILVVSNARTLTRIVDKLEEIDLSNKDIMGDVYEYLLSKLATSGQNGQFRTPRHIIKMMVELMQPAPEDAICDPAMGSAGFICMAAQYIKDHYKTELMRSDVQQRFQTTMFAGHDTDSTMMRIGAMNMMLHGVEAPNISQLDSLSEDNEERDAYTLIMANPPFKGSLDKETIAKDLRSTVSTTKTELLFLALFLKSLKVGGRCASIVPDGVLFGSQKAHKAIRKELIENNRLVAVISMPSGVFKPYAGVSTAILIFTRTDNGGTDNVWFYDMQADGFSLDDKREPIKDNDIPDIIERFHNLNAEKDRARTEKSFMVPVQEIIDNDYDLSINKYKEIVYEKVEYPPTSELIAEIKDLNEQIAKGIAELEAML